MVRHLVHFESTYKSVRMSRCLKRSIGSIWRLLFDRELQNSSEKIHEYVLYWYTACNSWRHQSSIFPFSFLTTDRGHCTSTSQHNNNNTFRWCRQGFVMKRKCTHRWVRDLSPLKVYFDRAWMSLFSINLGSRCNFQRMIYSYFTHWWSLSLLEG